MFARVKRIKTSAGKVREYLLIVENKRISGKVRQRIVTNLGRLELFRETNIADILIAELKDYAKTNKLMDMAKTACDWSKEYGIILILRRIWETIGLDELFKKYLQAYKYKTNLSESILALAISRLITPGSEHHTSLWLNSVYEPKWEGLQLQHFYRSLDFIYHHKQDLEKDLFFKTAYHWASDDQGRSAGCLRGLSRQYLRFKKLPLYIREAKRRI